MRPFRLAVVVSLGVFLFKTFASAVQLEKEGSTLIAGPAHFTGAEHLQSRIESDLGSSDFHIAAWVKTSHGGTILSKHTSHGETWDAHSKSLFIYRAGTVAFDVGHVGQVESKKVVSDGQWHHVALTFQKSSKQASLYIDGVQDAQIVMNIVPDPVGHVIKVGHTGLDFGGNFRGYMRAVKLSPTFISQADVLRIYKTQMDEDPPTESYMMVNLRAHSHMHLAVVASRSRRSEDLHPPDYHPDSPPALLNSAATQLAGPSFGVASDENHTGTPDNIVVPSMETAQKGQAPTDSPSEHEEKLRESAQERASKRELAANKEAADETAAKAAEKEVAEKAAAESAAAEKAAAEKAAAEKAAAEKAAAEKAAAEKAAAEKEASENEASEKVAAEKEASEKAAAEKAAAEKEAAEKAAAEKAAAEKEASEKAAAEKAAAENVPGSTSSEGALPEEDDEIAKIEAAAKQVVDDDTIAKKEGEAAKKAAEADALKKEADADLADASAEASKPAQ